MLTTEFYSLWQNTVFWGLSYEAANPLMFLVSFIFKYLLIYLIEELLGIGFSRKEKGFFLLYYAVLFLIYLFVPRGFTTGISPLRCPSPPLLWSFMPSLRSGSTGSI